MRDHGGNRVYRYDRIHHDTTGQRGKCRSTAGVLAGVTTRGDGTQSPDRKTTAARNVWAQVPAQSVKSAQPNEAGDPSLLTAIEVLRSIIRVPHRATSSVDSFTITAVGLIPDPPIARRACHPPGVTTVFPNAASSKCGRSGRLRTYRGTRHLRIRGSSL